MAWPLRLTDLRPADPGLLRLNCAIRTTAAALLTGVTVLPLLHHYRLPLIASAPGVLFTLLSSVFLRDRTVRDRQVTLALSFGAGAVALAAASLVVRVPYLAGIGLLALLGGSILGQARSPRLVTTTLVAFIGYYLGMFLRPSAAALTDMIACLAPAVIFAVAALRVIPNDPALTGHRALGSVLRQAKKVLAEARHPDVQRIRLERHLTQLSHAALMAEEYLQLANAPGQDALRGRLVNLEVAATHAALDAVKVGSSTSEERWQRAMSEVAHATAAFELRPVPGNGGAATIPPSGRPPRAGRPAVQASCAAVVAMIVGYRISPEHWYWAVTGVLVTFFGTRSSGEVVQKGVMRLAGTLMGGFAGVLVATLISPHPAVIELGMVLCVFGWSYFILNNYGLGIFFLTLLLGLAYTALGQSMAAVIWLRFAETVIGAATTFGLALWVMPIRTGEHVRTRVKALVGRLDDVVAAAQACLVGSADANPLAAMRLADRAMLELNHALQPVRASRLFTRDDEVDGLPAVLVCVHWTRVLATAVANARDTPPVLRTDLSTRLTHLRVQFASLFEEEQPEPELNNSMSVVTSDAASIRDGIEAVDQLGGAIELLRSRLQLPHRSAIALTG